ncbi:MAG: hypothetical protein RR244_07800 [Oscillospiraceae bacterium]
MDQKTKCAAMAMPTPGNGALCRRGGRAFVFWYGETADAGAVLYTI